MVHSRWQTIHVWKAPRIGSETYGSQTRGGEEQPLYAAASGRGEV
jgi:hypothetical protein